MFKIIKEHRWSLLGILLFSILLMLPFVINPYHENDDTVFHVANVVSLVDSMKMHGIFGSVILPNLANGFGYASHLLYPPIAHTFSSFIVSIFSSFGWTVTDGLKLVHVIVFLLSGLTMYELAYKLSHDKRFAFFSSIIYLTCPYHLSDHYVRDSLAEMFVFIFLPMIISGVISLFQGDKKKFFPLFVIGYVGGILSHFTIMIFFTIFLAIFLLVYYKEVFQKKFLIPFCLASLAVLGICLFFFIPMFEYKIRGGIVVFLEGVMSWGIYGTSLWPWEYLPFSHFHDGVTFGFSLVAFVLLIITLKNYKKIEHFEYSKGLAIMMLVCLFCSSKLFYFDILPSLFYMIQFAWRFCTFLVIGVSLFAPLCIRKWSKKSLVILGILILLFAYVDIHYRCDNIFIHSNEEVVKSGAAMGWQHEYLPEKAYLNETYYENRNHDILVQSGKSAVILEDSVPNLKFEAKKDSVLELPRLYYIGYRLENELGEEIPIYENEMGFIEVSILEDGIYTLQYPGTTLDRIGKYVSIFTLVISIVSYGIYYFITKKELS